MKVINKILLGVATCLSLTSCDLFAIPTLKVESLKIVNPQTKYYVNEEFVTPTVMATYEADSTGIAKSIDVTKKTSFFGFDSSQVGTYTVDVTYTEREVTLTDAFQYTVIEAPTLDKIEVDNPQMTYQLNDTFVKPTVIAYYTADKIGKKTSKEVSEKATCTGFDGTVAGNQTITVSYTENGVTKTTSYEVTVTGPFDKTKLKYTYDDFSENNYFPIDSCPTIGNAKLLVIPVWFTDSSNYISTSKKESVRDDISNAYFGSVEDTGWNSVKTYYETESHGKLSLSGTVSEWYECGKSSSILGSDNGTATGSFIKNAVSWYFNNHTSDSRRNYDCNGDGYLDGVMCIYAFPNYIDLYYSNIISSDEIENYSNYWAYAFWLQDSGQNSVTKPGLNCFFWASFDFMYGNNTASSRTGKNFSYGDTNYCSIDSHTFIHEMGHVFGLEDYYDYNGVASPAGGLTMQDHNVGGHDPYSVMALGWANPYIPKETMDINIHPFQDSGDLILLTPEWNSYDSPFDEYILIELYTPTGLNKFDSDHRYGSTSAIPSSAGIRVWHVDARLVDWNINDWAYAPTSSSSVTHAMSNTYYGSDSSHLSHLGDGYYDYNILQYIRRSTSTSYRPTGDITSNNMFKTGDSFSMNTYKSQFVNGTKLNNEKSLGWSFKIKSCSATSATITVTKE